MYSGKTVFAQIMAYLPRHHFDTCVSRYQGDYRVRCLPCIEHFYSMAFAQLTYRESLRDIVTCLLSMQNRLYHMGFKRPISRSTLADANELRNWRIYADVAQVLIQKARSLYANEDFGIELKNMVYALDSTTIDLSMSMFPWAHFRTTKSAIKVHTLLDIRGSIPAFIQITNGKIHEVNVIDQIVLEPGAFYLLDRGYLDCARLHRIHQAHASFITRTKSHTDLRRIGSRIVDKTTGLLCDQDVKFSNFYPARNYPDPLRKIRFFDSEEKRIIVFLTNNFELPALTITQLYKCRWKVELFFKWIKQHLRIKAFYGTSENAVKTQIWIAICVYLLIAVMKKELKIDLSLYSILQILSITVFEKCPIVQVLQKYQRTEKIFKPCNQLNLFDS